LHRAGDARAVGERRSRRARELLPREAATAHRAVSVAATAPRRAAALGAVRATLLQRRAAARRLAARATLRGERRCELDAELRSRGRGDTAWARPFGWGRLASRRARTVPARALYSSGLRVPRARGSARFRRACSAVGEPPTERTSPMPFLAYDLAMQLVTELEAPIAAIATRNAEEADQLERARCSVFRNLAEGGGRRGRDRRRFYEYAYGSLRETKASLQLAVAKRWLAEMPGAYATAHRLGGMLYRLAGR
jgi:four helix bundle protein